jgi:hypothetical protein
MCSARRVSTTTDSLPNDIESLRALAAQAITERDVAIAEREAAMKERDAERAEKAKLVAERDRLQSLYEPCASPSSQGERSPLWCEERAA